MSDNVTNDENILFLLLRNRERERIVEQVIYWFNLFVDFHNEMTFEKMVK